MFLNEIANNTESGVGKTKMLSGQFLGQYLSMISMLLQPKNVLEIGTFTGYGTICLREGIQAGGKIVTIEKDATHADVAKDHFAKSTFQNIEMHVGDAKL